MIQQQILLQIPWNVGSYLDRIAVSPDGTKVYVTNYGNYGTPGNISVIDTTTNTVTANMPVGINPVGLAVSPDGTKVYVANYWGNTTSVINTATNTVTATVPGDGPFAVSITPDGKKVYVTNLGSNHDFSGKTVSVIDTGTNNVVNTVNVGSSPNGIAIASG